MPDAIAVVGVAFRGPGAASYRELVDVVLDGRETLTELSDEDLRRAGVPDDLRENPRYVRRRPMLDDPWGFDREHFGLSDREARVRNPQHRLFLELAATALQDANLDPRSLGGQVGVYGGCAWDDYLQRNVLADARTRRLVGEMGARMANSRDYLAPFTSYMLDLSGPSLSISTACSTGLVAVHVACQALKAGECDAALAGAVDIEMPHAHGYLPTPGGVESLDGYCRPFDVGASGTVFGSGGGVVALMLIDDALDLGMHVYGVISGSAVNNDGRGKSTFSSPNPVAQTALVTEALSVAHVDAARLGYVELHATATRVGDAVEVESLARALTGTAATPLDPASIAIGSVKANIGHLGSAAGVAGLLKVLGCIERRTLPPATLLDEVNPRLRLQETPFRLPEAAEPWPDSAPVSGVSAFGFGGTNAHLVVEAAPVRSRPTPVAPRSPALLTWSVTDPLEFDEYERALGTAVAQSGAPLSEICAALALTRPMRASRRWAVVHDVEDAVDALRHGEQPPGEVLTPGGAQVDGTDLRSVGLAWQQGDDDALRELFAGARTGAARLPVSPWHRREAYIEPPTDP